MNASLSAKRAFVIFTFSWLVLFLEVLCTQIFAFTLWYHLGFMAISIALLGFAGAGSWLSVPGKLWSLDKALAWLSVLSSLAIIFSFFLVSRIQFGLDPSLIFKMLILYLLLAIPFFFFGLVIALSFKHYSHEPGRVYFWNLIGSAGGALSVFLLLPRIGAEQCLTLSSGLALLTGLIFIKEAGKKIVPILSLSILILLLSLILPAKFFPFQPLKNKTIVKQLQTTPDTRIELTRWSSPTRIDIVDDSSGTLIFGKPLSYKFIYMNGEFPTMILKVSPEIDLKPYFQKSPYNLSYLVSPKPKEVLIIGPGGGTDVHNALWQDVKAIDAVEVNPAIVEMVKTVYASYTGEVYQDPRVRVMVADGRNWLRRTDKKYDLIQLSYVDTFASPGPVANILTESWLYTVEAFKDYFQHLTPNGRFSIMRYRMIPPREEPKAVVLAIKALREMGIEHPEEHIICLLQGIWFQLMVQKSPFSPEQVQDMQNQFVKGDWNISVRFPLSNYQTESLKPEFLWYPGCQLKNLFADLLRQATQGKEDDFIKAYTFDIRPAYDNSPFFFKYGDFQIKWRNSRITLGLMSVLIQIGEALVLSVLLILLPLFHLRKKTKPGFKILIYFSALGIAYFFIEIVLMQKLALFLGHPFYAIGIVLAGLLFASSLGSYALGLIPEKWLKVMTGSLVILIGVYLAGLDHLINLFLPLRLYPRVFLTLLILLPIGFLMGIPFPLGLLKLSKSEPELIAWSWAINGVFSVLSASSVVLLSMHLGFPAVLAASAIFYLVALFCL